MEPLDPDVPDHRHEDPVGPLRLSAALGAVVLVLASNGHVLVLGALLAVVVRTRAGGIAALVASTAVLVRWGGPSLSAVAGGQAVLGPAVAVGSTAAALSALLAATAIALLAPKELPLVVAVGVVAGAVAAGPELPHDIGIRVLGAAAGMAAAYAARWVPFRAPAALGLAGGALVLAAA